MNASGTDPVKPLASLLVKPAGPDCNLACTYCFYLEKAAQFPERAVHRMTETVLEATIRSALSGSGQTVYFAWQGGEPTLMGLDFFKTAVRVQRRHGKDRRIENGLQTNGLLMNEAWARFLKRTGFLVGLSLDGPEHIHDRYRRTRSGSGSWAQVLEKGRLLLDAGVAVNALSVVNDYSVRFPEEIYRFLKDQGLTFMQFIPVVETDADRMDRPAPFSVPPGEYGEFLCRMFDLWHDDINGLTPSTYIRFFESVFYSYVGKRPPECTLLPGCGEYVVVEHNGDVFSCDFFVETDWKLGNVLEKSLEDLLNTRRQKAFGERKSNLPAPCTSCRWLHRCRGGCTKDRIRDPRTQGLNYFCPAFKMFFEHADARLQKLGEAWRQEHEKDRAGRNQPCPCGSGRKRKKCCGENG